MLSHANISWAIVGSAATKHGVNITKPPALRADRLKRNLHQVYWIKRRLHFNQDMRLCPYAAARSRADLQVTSLHIMRHS